MHGAIARVVWGYHVGAELVDYTLAPDVLAKGAWTLTGRATTRDPYVLAQAPLVFVAPTKHGALRWGLASVRVTADGAVFGRFIQE